MRQPWRIVLTVVALALPLAESGSAQRDGDLPGLYDNVDYNGRFTFSRIRYRGRGYYGSGSWAHDYPRADRHLPRILQEITTLEPNIDGSNVFDLDDPEIFRHPIIYVSEPGTWYATDTQIQNLRRFFLKGGFAIFDDFEEEQLENLELQLRRAVPEYTPIKIDVRHPIFHTFFDMTKIDFPHPLVPVTGEYLAIFENNDPNARMLAILNWNCDLAEYWEWSDTGMFGIDLTNEAYKLGVNYIVYGMSH